MAKTQIINLIDLQINTENYRFEPVASQKEAIDMMIDDQGEKIYKLAEHIVYNGLNPNDKIQVVSSSHDKTKFNVVEGNRRTVSLKLLSNPDLIDSNHHIGLKRKFKKLHDDNKKAIPKSIECTVYDNPAEADKWIKLKHAGQLDGIGTVTWTAHQIDRFEEKVEGKSSISLQAIKLLEKSPNVPTEVKSNLKTLKVSNFERLISDPSVRNFLGIEINNGVIQSNIEEKEVVKGLTFIAKDLLDPKFNVKRIYTKEDRTDYISKIPKSHKPDTSKTADKPWQFNNSNTTNPKQTQTKPKPNPKHRKTLIPKSCSLRISKPKVNAIYHELIKLDIIKFTNAAAISLRVFVELSIDSYLEEHSLISTPSAAKSGMDFQQKINVVANHMESKKFADAAICKGIKSEIKDKNDIMGIDTWHAYVHNNKFAPKEKNLIITWDNIQSFIEAIWLNIK
ncbi:MAG: hypothetical protein J0L83_03820 [Chitinophagales bacterium]|nr:hypothetical protein [Chitinophagales bacterium]